MKLVPITAALLLSSSAAFAADLAPQPAEPMAPVIMPFSWTGFYVGAHAGAVFARPKLESFGINSTGFIGGVHAGYNLQFDNNIVVGVEGDIDYTSLSKKKFLGTINQGDSQGSIFLKFKSDWQGSVRGRLGYAMGQFLPYVTAGVAFTDQKYTLTAIGNVPVVGAGSFSASKTSVGWTAGAGLEYAINEHWIVRGEVRYTDFGKQNFRFTGFDGRSKGRFNEVSTLVGVSYKF